MHGEKETNSHGMSMGKYEIQDDRFQEPCLRLSAGMELHGAMFSASGKCTDAS